MRYSNTVKVTVFVLILLISAGVGWFGIYDPMVEQLLKMEQSIESKKTQISSAQQVISENIALRAAYGEALEKAIEAQKIFYPEMTTIQAIDEVNKILSSGGFKSGSGITVSRMSSSALSITLSKVEESVNYEVRQHSFLNDNAMTTQKEEDNSNGLPRADTFKMLENGEFSGSAKIETIDSLRSALARESIEIGRITVNFTLNLNYAEYIEFLNLIENHGKAISIQSARFKGDNVSHDDPEEYRFEIYLYIVKPVDEL